MITLQKPIDKNFVILNLSDTQLSFEEFRKGHKYREILDYTVGTLIDRVHPDLITISGDLCCEHDDAAYVAFADYFDALSIPWAPIFGNHDNMSPPEKLNVFADDFLSRRSCVFEKGDPELGIGNYVIKICENERVLSALIMIDAHEVYPYTDKDGTEKLSYETLWPNQMEWYREQIKALKSEGCSDSAMILHTPIFAYRDAVKKAYKKDVDKVGMKWGESLSADVWNESYEDSVGVCREIPCAPVFDDGVFELLKEQAHTKLVVAGHDHKNNFIIDHNGIKLVYATKTGAGCYYDADINGGTVIEIGKNGIKKVYQEMVDILNLV